MPTFLEEKLKRRYAGRDPSIPYKIMNRLGYMRGNRETAAGAAAQRKHERDMRRAGGRSKRRMARA